MALLQQSPAGGAGFALPEQPIGAHRKAEPAGALKGRKVQGGCGEQRISGD